MRSPYASDRLHTMESFETDQDLIIGCLANHRRAWNVFVQRHSRYVYFMITKTSSRYNAHIDAETTADLHADVFASFIERDYRRLRDFEGRNQCSLRSWVRMITVRKTIDLLRKKNAKTVSMETLRSSSGFEPVSAEADSLTQLIDHEHAQHSPSMETLARVLSDQDRLLLDLVLVQGLKAAEVSKALNISVGAVYTRKNRLIERMRASREKSS
jgi:RNA polymerase sigma factor (sigma-70 family)